jgi:hypothetical protein
MRRVHAVRPNQSSEGGEVCSGEVELAGGSGQQNEAEEKQEQQEQEESESGKRSCRKVLSPTEPSPQERAEHELTHLPFRNWCRHCCRGRGVEMAHRKTDGAEKRLPEIHFDFCFLGDEKGRKLEVGETLPVLVVREVHSKMVLSAGTPSKSTGNFIARRCLAFLREIGCESCDVIVKSDNEPAITSIISEVGRMRAATGGGKWIVENSPVGSSASNGVVERAIRSVSQQARVMKDGLEHKAKMLIGARHPLMPWIVEYAGHLLNRFEVSQDGKTAYERLKGKSARTLGIEFGESVLWKRRAVGGALAKATCLWEDGIFLGIRGASGEIIVADEKGVWKTRSIQRKPPSERWAEGALEVVRHVPWRVSDSDPNVDGEKLQLDGMSRKLEEPEVQLQKDVAVAPNRFMIRKEDLERHGYSANCQGCRSILRGTARQGHSESCRKRIEEALKDDPRIKLQRIKEKEYVERRLEEQEAKRRKKEKEEEEEEESSEEASKRPAREGGQEGLQDEEQSKRPRLDEDSQALTEAASGSGDPSMYVPARGGDVEMAETGERERRPRGNSLLRGSNRARR